MEDSALRKTTRINQLLDLYGPLLTEKQQLFLRCYFHDDYSLGEIAAEFNISRQAVYEHIKRAEQVLEDCEQKLALRDKQEARQRSMRQLQDWVDMLPLEEQQLVMRGRDLIRELNELD